MTSKGVTFGSEWPMDRFETDQASERLDIARKRLRCNPCTKRTFHQVTTANCTCYTAIWLEIFQDAVWRVLDERWQYCQKHRQPEGRHVTRSAGILEYYECHWKRMQWIGFGASFWPAMPVVVYTLVVGSSSSFQLTVIKSKQPLLYPADLREVFDM